MKAIRVHQTGDANQLKYEDAPLPEPQAGQVRVKVAAAGLNFIETYQRSGLYPMPLPFTPGGEFAGTVDALGEGVQGFAVGEPVATSQGSGAYAEYALAPADKLAKVPNGVSTEQAAAVLLQGITAHYLATSTFPLNPGDTALVHAAAGGVGQLLVQIAKRCGARVLATCSTEEKAAIARQAGADEVILYSQVDFAAEVQKLTGGKGVDVVYDGVGAKTFEKSLDCLRPRGMMVTFGNASGPAPDISPLLLSRKGSLFLTRPSIGAYVATQEEFLGRVKDLFDWMLAGDLNVNIDRSFPMAEAADAHKYIEEGRTKGKVLLIP